MLGWPGVKALAQAHKQLGHLARKTQARVDVAQHAEPRQPFEPLFGRRLASNR